MTTKRPVWLHWSQLKRRPAVVARLAFSQLVCPAVKLSNWVTSVGEVGWRNATISLMIVAAAVYVFAALYIFKDPTVFQIGKEEVVFGPDVRARAVTPLLLGLAGFVTLVATLWRGTIAARQTEEQKRQNDSKEEADLGLLLEKGHEHTAKGKVNDIALGIAMLDTVAQAENDKYASYALYEIGRQLELSYMMKDKDRFRIFTQIEGVFTRLAEDPRTCHRRPNYVLRWEFPETEHETIIVDFARYLPACKISGARIITDRTALARINDMDREIHFDNCRISALASPNSSGMFGGSEQLTINSVTTDRFLDCDIENFSISQIGHSTGFKDWVPRVTFVRCNLTRTAFVSDNVLTDCTFRDCYFFDDDAPWVVSGNGPLRIEESVLAEHGITSRPTLLGSL